MKTRKIYKFVQTHLCSMHSIDHGTDTNITIQYALYIDVPIFVSIYSIHLQYIHLSTVLFIYLIWLCIFIKYIYIYTAYVHRTATGSTLNSHRIGAKLHWPFPRKVSSWKRRHTSPLRDFWQTSLIQLAQTNFLCENWRVLRFDLNHLKEIKLRIIYTLEI